VDDAYALVKAARAKDLIICVNVFTDTPASAGRFAPTRSSMRSEYSRGSSETSRRSRRSFFRMQKTMLKRFDLSLTQSSQPTRTRGSRSFWALTAGVRPRGTMRWQACDHDIGMS
jgi:hypothetical protein